MRRPSDQYAWHRAALAGQKPQITHTPECGWFRRRTSRGGPFVAVKIFLEQQVDPETGELLGDEVMRCEVDGKRRVPEEEWTWVADNPISEEEFLDMLAPTFTAAGESRPHHLPF